MAKVFNVTGVCIPEEHYMVSLAGRLKKIKRLVDDGKYFCINRARQYGKTTTLMALEQYLKDDYYVVSMDFQTFGSAEFQDENRFALSFAYAFLRLLNKNKSIPKGEFSASIEELNRQIESRDRHFSLMLLFEILSDICAEASRPMVLMIDEVDSAANHQVFLDFLAQLRAYYLKRMSQPVFRSVILAGVYDIKNLKRKFRTEEEQMVNSPWNVAADFDIDMSFSKSEIAGMLREYESDYRTDMDIEEMAGLLFKETSGYPFLVSRLCKLMDEVISREKGSRAAAWTMSGFMEAYRLLTTEKNTLLESLVGKVMNYPELNDILQNKIFNGETVAYTATNPVIDLAAMFGIIRNAGGVVAPANKLFAKVLSDYYLSMDEMKSLDIYKVSLQNRNLFVNDGKLDMKFVIERFLVHFGDLYGQRGEKFVEKEGRKYFLLYLKPIINGVGHYSMEAVTTSENRTDLIVYYGEELFILEMKIWHGPKRHEESERQLLGYMADYHQERGYLLTFNFNKRKEPSLREVELEGKLLIEAMI